MIPGALQPENTLNAVDGLVTGSAEDSSPSEATAKIVHELNNPLDASIRYLSLAQKTLASGHTQKTEQYLQDALFGLQRMADVLRQLAPDPDGGDASSLSLFSRPPIAKLDYIIQRAADALGPQMRHSHVEIHKEIPAGISIPVTLYHVLLNLLENAVDAMPYGGCVVISACAEGEQLVIIISDQGGGILPENLPHIFEPFFTCKPPGQGTGLGLTVCKKLITRLNGTISAENVEVEGKKGTCFTLRIPTGK